MLGECFDPKGELLIREHCRPHWSQAGAVVFITFRTYDSIPREVIERWDREKQEWLRHRGRDTGAHWSVIVETLSEKERADFQKTFNRCREAFLDSCHGRCLLKRPELAQIVADSLLHFDGQRYRMGDFVVMPNHVHLLAVFPTPEAMREQCDSWLHYTAFRINRAIGEKGKFWQQEPFDHLVRSPEQYEYLRQYIADHPQKAGLVLLRLVFRLAQGKAKGFSLGERLNPGKRLVGSPWGSQHCKATPKLHGVILGRPSVRRSALYRGPGTDRRGAESGRSVQGSR